MLCKLLLFQQEFKNQTNLLNIPKLDKVISTKLG